MNIAWFMSRQRRHLPIFLLFSCLFILVGCSSSNAASLANHTKCSAASSLRGAGSTFDATLFEKQFSVYAATSCGLPIEYYPVGSGAGASQLLNQLVDFGASDAPLTDRQLASSPNGVILHVPVTLGAVAVSYHLTGVSSPLHLSGPVLASIYLGSITMWDDPALRALNADLPLPHRSIQVIYRADGSGTTAIFTHYLAAISSQWRQSVGASTQVPWPLGQGEQGSVGVAEALTRTEGAIGYIELSYVTRQHLVAVAMENAAGLYISPSITGVQAAATAVQNIPPDLRFYIVSAPGVSAYPLAGYSWAIVYRHQRDAEKGKAVAQLLWWMIHDGQQYAQSLMYVPLAANIVTKAEAQIRLMTCGINSDACLS